MKNINTKKVVAGVAALGLSALLAGSVVASNVGGDNFSMNITKDTMYNASGVPIVSIVVGNEAQTADVVWAGNIAAAIGKKAYVSTGVAGGAALQDVTIDVGTTSTSTVTGDGYLSDKDLDINMTKNAAKHISLISTDYSALFDDDVYGNITGNSNYNVRQTESLDLNLATFFSKNKKVKDITTFMEKGDISYKLTFATPIDFNKDNSEYFSAGDSLPIHFMGGIYDLQDVTFGSVVKVSLVGSGSKTVKKTGDEFSVGKYVLKVGDVTSSSTNPKVYMSLLDNGAEVASALFKINDKVSFTGYTLEDTIKIVSADKLDNAPDIIELSIGSAGLLELEDGKVLPGYGTSSDKQWTVSIAADKTSKKLSSITVYNDKRVFNVEDASHERAGAGPNEVIALPLGLGSIDFMGLTNEKLYEFSVGDNKISWVDTRSREYTIPMYESSISGTVKFGFNDYYFVDTNSDNKLHVFKGTSDTTPFGNATGYADKSILTLDLEKGYDVNYTVIKNGNTFDLAIMEQTKGLDIGKSNATWNFIRSETDNNLSTLDVNFFDNNSIKNSGKGLGIFSVSDLTNNSFLINIDLATQDLVRKSDFTTGNNSSAVYTSQVDYNSSPTVTSWSLDQDHADDLRFGYSLYGSYAEVDGSKLTLQLPENKRFLQAFVGGGASTESTLNGGTLVLTTPGTVVTTDDGKISAKLVSSNVTGSSSTVAMTPANWNVSNSRLVYLDSDMSGAGTKIIVGGHAVNTLADGITRDYLTEAGQYVVGSTSTGNIIVAGFTADDTAKAAKELIGVIENFG